MNHSSGSTIALRVGTLNDSGLLDLGNNAMVVHNPGSLGNILTLVQSGLGTGTWNGLTGITSSAAAASTSHLTTLGVILNDNGSGTALYGTGGTIASTFDGVTPVDNDVLLKYTYFGDTNLDGKVDGSDYSRIDAAYLANQTNPGSVTGWFNGDFNYDGVINDRITR